MNPYLIIEWGDEVLGPGGIWGQVQGVGSDHWGTRSLPSLAPHSRAARFLVEFLIKKHQLGAPQYMSLRGYFFFFLTIAIAIWWKHSQLLTGFVHKMAERFQFVLRPSRSDRGP